MFRTDRAAERTVQDEGQHRHEEGKDSDATRIFEAHRAKVNTRDYDLGQILATSTNTTAHRTEGESMLLHDRWNTPMVGLGGLLSQGGGAAAGVWCNTQEVRLEMNAEEAHPCHGRMRVPQR